jgi:hypothetical protein
MEKFSFLVNLAIKAENSLSQGIVDQSLFTALVESTSFGYKFEGAFIFFVLARNQERAFSKGNP